MIDLTVNIPGKSPEVIFVQLPLAQLFTPSASIGLLKAELTDRNIPCAVHFGDLLFVSDLDPAAYDFLSDNHGMGVYAGERIFAHVTGLPISHDTDEYLEKVEEIAQLTGCSEQYRKIKDRLPEFQAKAADFIRREAALIVSQHPKIVACPCMFFQINSVIAFCRAVKELDSSIITLVGGANCMGSAGIAMANLIPWIDYTFSGEADECIADLCQLLIERGNDVLQEELPYGAIKKNGYKLTDNAPCRLTKNLDSMAVPDYSDYFAQMQAAGLEKKYDKVVVIEFSRGCWWGQLHPCTFCGLNGKINIYREKSPQRLLEEIRVQHERYGTELFMLSDNILSRNHLKDLLPQLNDFKLHFFSEIKSNNSRREMEILRDAGFRWLQAGVESLHDKCLTLMNKGNRAIRHLELLKNARRAGIRIFWNLMAGFPGEDPQWYQEQLDLMKKIPHFQPPGMYRPLQMQRYNAYWKNQEKYGLQLMPAEINHYVYPSVPGLIEEISYCFDHVDPERRRISRCLGSVSSIYPEIEGFIHRWLITYHTCVARFSMTDYGDRIELFDLREIADDSLISLTGCQAEVYRLADEVVTMEAVRRTLEGKYTAEEIETAVCDMDRRNLLVRIGDEILALALPENCPPPTMSVSTVY